MQQTARHLPAGERRAATVRTVVALAAEQNPGEITTAAIAERMNLSQAAIFRHFPSKDAIWQAVMEWVAERLLARLDEAAGGAATPLAALEAIFSAHIEFVAAHPGVPRMMFGELQRAEDTAGKRMARTLLARYDERLKSLITRAKETGEVDAAVDTATAAALFVGTIQGLVMQSLLSGAAPSLRSAAPGAFALYRRAIAAA
ncbi:MAG: TetR family transcriptional regulator [Hyphomicrobiales bacterium]